MKADSKLPESVSPVQNWLSISVKDGQSDDQMSPQNKNNKKKELVIFQSYLLEAFEVDLYVPITWTEIREEGINVRTDDQRCVKSSFARLLPDFSPLCPRHRHPQIEPHWIQTFGISSAPSPKNYHLSFRTGAPSGGWGETKTSW